MFRCLRNISRPYDVCILVVTTKETGMNFRIIPRSTSILIVVATIGIPGVAMANRGGGDSGDSSMNPFTGDSYAYFHGGHNLGEQGTIRPNRVTARPDASSDRHASRTPSPAAAGTTRTPDAPTTDPAPRSETR